MKTSYAAALKDATASFDSIHLRLTAMLHDHTSSPTVFGANHGIRGRFLRLDSDSLMANFASLWVQKPRYCFYAYNRHAVSCATPILHKSLEGFFSDERLFHSHTRYHKPQLRFVRKQESTFVQIELFDLQIECHLGLGPSAQAALNSINAGEHWVLFNDDSWASPTFQIG